MQAAVPVVLRNKQVRRIRTVHPLRHVFDGIVKGFARVSVHQYHALDGFAAKQTDSTGLNRANPPGRTIFVDFKALLLKHIEGIAQLHVTVDIFEEGVGLRIVDGLVQTHHARILTGHVNQHVGRNTRTHVVEPLKEVRIIQRAHTHRTLLIVNLRIQWRNFKLAYVFGNFTQGTVAQKLRRFTIDYGDGIVVHFLDVCGKVGIFDMKNVGITFRITRPEAPAQDGTNKSECRNKKRNIRQELKGLCLLGACLTLATPGFVGLAAPMQNKEDG